MLGGVLLRYLGQPFGFFAWGRAAAFVSAGLDIAAGALFVVFFVALAAGQAGKYGRADPLHRFVRAGTAYFILSLLVLGAQDFWFAGHLETALPVSLTELFYFASLYGFLLAWIYGFASRMVSTFLGTGPAQKTS